MAYGLLRRFRVSLSAQTRDPANLERKAAKHRPCWLRQTSTTIGHESSMFSKCGRDRLSAHRQRRVEISLDAIPRAIPVRARKEEESPSMFRGVGNQMTKCHLRGQTFSGRNCETDSGHCDRNVGSSAADHFGTVLLLGIRPSGAWSTYACLAEGSRSSRWIIPLSAPARTSEPDTTQSR